MIIVQHKRVATATPGRLAIAQNHRVFQEVNMSLHHAPLHRPSHHLTSAEGMIILVVASVVVLLVIAALTMPVTTTTNKPVVGPANAAAEQARLEFRRGEWSGTRASVYTAEQARLEFRQGEWRGTQIDEQAAERARLEFRRGEWYCK